MKTRWGHVWLWVRGRRCCDQTSHTLDRALKKIKKLTNKTEKWRMSRSCHIGVFVTISLAKWGSCRNVSAYKSKRCKCYIISSVSLWHDVRIMRQITEKQTRTQSKPQKTKYRINKLPECRTLCLSQTESTFTITSVYSRTVGSGAATKKTSTITMTIKFDCVSLCFKISMNQLCLEKWNPPPKKTGNDVNASQGSDKRWRRSTAETTTIWKATSESRGSFSITTHSDIWSDLKQLWAQIISECAGFLHWSTLNIQHDMPWLI